MDKTKQYPTWREKCKTEFALAARPIEARVADADRRMLETLGCPRLEEYQAAKKDRATADSDLKYHGMVRDAVLDLVNLLSAQGHSGGSIRTVVAVLTELVEGKPLTPLTGEADEWIQTGHKALGVMEAGMPDHPAPIDTVPVWQNSRCSRVFAEGEIGTPGFKAYLVDGLVWRDPSGACYTNYASRVDIPSFPFTPENRIVDVDGSGNPLPPADNEAMGRMFRVMWRLREIDRQLAEGVDYGRVGELVQEKARIYASLDDALSLANQALGKSGVAPVRGE